MRTLQIAALLLLLCTAVAQADTKETKDKLTDTVLAQATDSLVLTMAGGYSPPAIRPKLANLRRSYTPSADNLITKFLGGRQTLIGSGDPIVSPLWGKGTRYKSGSLIQIGPKQNLRDVRQLQKLESVAAFVDVYQSGYLYSNTAPHKAVNMPAPKVEAQVLKPQHRNLFTVKDGQASVEQQLPSWAGEVKVPKGFRKRVDHSIQTYGERLYAYRLTPEYVTSYPVYAKDGKTVASEKPIAVPVLDSYLHVLLDGDKVLAGMEYFWDNNLTVEGTPKPCIGAPQAINKAQAWLLKRYGTNPPLYVVNNMRLGFIQDRSNRNLLVPAWIFDAWYHTPIPSSVGTTENPVKRTNDPFAINALNGNAIDL
jgi:hypothetical protein